MNTNAGTVINGKRTTYHTWPYETAGNEAWYSAAGSTLLQSLYVRIDPLSLVPMCGVDVAWSESECYDHEREREQERERECSDRQATKQYRFCRRNEGRRCEIWIIWLMLIATFDHRQIYRMRVFEHTYFSPATTFKGRVQLHKAGENYMRETCCIQTIVNWISGIL